jgi:hypothetical protein
MEKAKYSIGILAYGSLIDDAGKEIKDREIHRIDCETPFSVEFARRSRTRCNAPTLIPFDSGKYVKAKIIVLPESTTLDEAKNMLWRRELHKPDNNTETYKKKSSSNAVVIEIIDNFMEVEKVLYTKIDSNIKNLTGEKLAKLAIQSIRCVAGEKEKDGIRYLKNAKKNGIITTLSEDYEKEILKQTGTNSLKEAIEKLDDERNRQLSH